MGCKAGYPASPCPFGYEGRCDRKHCGACKHYAPPPHILNDCALWDRDRVLCLKPKSACETCAECMSGRAKVASAQARVDWEDPTQVRAYEARWRAENPDLVFDKAERFKARNPNYFTDRMRRLRAAKKGGHGNGQ